MIDTGISIAWLSEGVPLLARSTIARTWTSLRKDPTWSAWLSANVDAEQFIVVHVEDCRRRSKTEQFRR